MDDLAAKIEQLERLRPMLGDAAVNAAIAALRAEVAVQQRREIGEDGSVVRSPQTIAGSPQAGGTSQGMQVGSGQIIHSPQTTTNVDYAELVTIHPPPRDPVAAKQARDLLTYLRRLRGECNTLPIGQLDPTDAAHARPLELARVYIGLHTTAQVELTEAEEQALAKQHQRAVGEREMRLLTAVEAFGRAEQRRLLLLGAPGGGKSTFVSHLTLCLAGAALAERVANEPQPEGGWLAALPGWTLGPLLPIRVILRDFAAFAPLAAAPRGSVSLLLDVLATTLREAGCADALEPIKTALDDGRAILLLDGLDEVVREEVLARVTESIADAARTYPRSPILVTCRILDYQAERLRQIPGFPTQTLADLTDEQIAQFVADWYAELAASGRRTPAQACDDTQALQQAISARPELRNLTRLPLLLTVMALVHTNKGTLPDARALLYQECIELLLLRWRQPRGGSDLLARLGLSQFRSSDLLALLAHLGFHAHELAERAEGEQRPADLREGEVIELLAGAFAIYDSARKYELAETLLNAVAGGNGLLLKRGPDTYAFPHRTFQEFLAGYHLKGQREYLKLCLTRASQAHWHEALLLMAGEQVLADRELEKPLLLAEKLLKCDPTEQVLAGKLLNLIGRERATTYNPALTRAGGLWHRARTTLLRLATQGRAPVAPAALRVRVSLALGTLCYGSLDALCQGGVMPPLPDPRLPLAVVGLPSARSAKWRAALDAYWCPIAADSFWYGDDGEHKPLQKMTIPYDYLIARYPLTNAEFARFVASGGYAERRWWTTHGWEARERYNLNGPPLFDDPLYNNPLQPIVSVSWYEAAAYCLWLTEQGHMQGWLPHDKAIRLPTSLEWERAARHTDKRRYPWGEEVPSVEYANYNETGIGRPSPVGCFPSGMASCGALDMAGNVMEWMATDYKEPLAMEAKKDFTDRDGVLLSYGSYWGKEEYLCCGIRNWYFPNVRFIYRSFRIVRTRILIV